MAATLNHKVASIESAAKLWSGCQRLGGHDVRANLRTRGIEGPEATEAMVPGLYAPVAQGKDSEVPGTAPGRELVRALALAPGPRQVDARGVVPPENGRQTVGHDDLPIVEETRTGDIVEELGGIAADDPDLRPGFG